MENLDKKQSDKSSSKEQNDSRDNLSEHAFRLMKSESAASGSATKLIDGSLVGSLTLTDVNGDRKSEQDTSPHGTILDKAQGHLRCGSNVYDVRSGVLFQKGEDKPCGTLNSDFSIDLKKEGRISLENRSNVLLQLKFDGENKVHRFFSMSDEQNKDAIGLAGGLYSADEMLGYAGEITKQSSVAKDSYQQGRSLITRTLGLDGASNALTQITDDMKSDLKLLRKNIDYAFKNGFDASGSNDEKLTLCGKGIRSAVSSFSENAGFVSDIAKENSLADKTLTDASVMGVTSVLTAGSTGVLAGLYKAGQLGKAAFLGGSVVSGALSGGSVSAALRHSETSNDARNFFTGAAEGTLIGAAGSSRVLMEVARAGKSALYSARAVDAFVQTAGFNAAAMVREGKPLEQALKDAVDPQVLALGLSAQGFGELVGLVAGRTVAKLGAAENGLLQTFIKDIANAYGNGAAGSINSALEAERERIAKTFFCEPGKVTNEMLRVNINLDNVLQHMETAGREAMLAGGLTSLASHGVQRYVGDKFAPVAGKIDEKVAPQAIAGGRLERALIGEVGEIREEKIHTRVAEPSSFDLDKEAARLSGLAARVRDSHDAARVDNFIEGFKTHASIRNISDHEIARTLHQVSELLEAKNTQLTRAERAAVAADILANATEPFSIRQGAHPTCSTAQLSVQLYSRVPSEAARVIKEAIVSGQVHCADGARVSIAAGDIKSDVETSLVYARERSARWAETSWEANTGRSHADKILQNILANTHWQLQSTGPDAQPYPAGQIKYGNSRDEHGYFFEGLFAGGKKLSENPYLRGGDFESIYHRLVGGEKIQFTISHRDANYSEHPSGKLADSQLFSSEKEMHQLLQRLKPSQNNPILIINDLSAEPFHRDWGNGGSAEVGGSHVNGITGMPELESGTRIYEDNTWTPKKEYTAENGKSLSLREAYVASLPVGSKEKLQLLALAAKGNPVKLLEYYRERYRSGNMPPAAYEKQLNWLENKMAKNQLAHDSASSREDFEYARRLIDVTRNALHTGNIKPPMLSAACSEVVANFPPGAAEVRPGFSEKTAEVKEKVGPQIMPRDLYHVEREELSVNAKIAHRGDNALKSRVNSRNWKKAYMDEEENLVSAAGGRISHYTPEQLNEAIIKHVNARANKESKMNSEFISFGCDDSVLKKYGEGHGVEIALADLRQAIKNGDVKNCKIIDCYQLLDAIEKAPPRSVEMNVKQLQKCLKDGSLKNPLLRREVQNAIENAPASGVVTLNQRMKDGLKNILCNFVMKDREILIMGTVPSAFLKPRSHRQVQKNKGFNERNFGY